MPDKQIPTDTVSDANHQEAHEDLVEIKRERDLLRRALAQLVAAADTAVDERGRHKVMTPAWDQARQVLHDTGRPAYPGTQFLILCRWDRRRGGQVTVGESRLPVHAVLGTLRHHGVIEAWISWPQVTEDEMAVLAQLVADLDARGDDGPGGQ